MDSTMKAAVVREFGKPLVIEEVPVPRPAAGDILVKIEACGVCHTDLHAAEGDWPAWGRSNAGTRYTAAAQITPGNVAHLKVAWRYSTGELKRRNPAQLANSTNETTPILAAGSLITCTPFSRVIALDRDNLGSPPDP